MSTHLGSIDPDKVDLALMLPCDGLNGLGNLLPLGIARLDKDVREGKSSIRVGGKVVGRNLVKEGDGVLAHECSELGDIDSSDEVVAALIEGLVEDDGGGADARDLGGVERESEEVVVAVDLGVLCEGSLRHLIRLGEVGNDDELVGRLELVVVRCSDVGDGRKRLPGESSQYERAEGEEGGELTCACSSRYRPSCAILHTLMPLRDGRP